MGKSILLYQSCTCVVGFFALFGEYGLMALLLGFMVKQSPGPIGLAVVLELQSLAAYEKLGGAGVYCYVFLVMLSSFHTFMSKQFILIRSIELRISAFPASLQTDLHGPAHKPVQIAE